MGQGIFKCEILGLEIAQQLQALADIQESSLTPSIHVAANPISLSSVPGDPVPLLH